MSASEISNASVSVESATSRSGRLLGLDLLEVLGQVHLELGLQGGRTGQLGAGSLRAQGIDVELEVDLDLLDVGQVHDGLGVRVVLDLEVNREVRRRACLRRCALLGGGRPGGCLPSGGLRLGDIARVCGVRRRGGPLRRGLLRGRLLLRGRHGRGARCGLAGGGLLRRSGLLRGLGRRVRPGGDLLRCRNRRGLLRRARSPSLGRGRSSGCGHLAGVARFGHDGILRTHQQMPLTSTSGRARHAPIPGTWSFCHVPESGRTP